jgi:tetratricopeptide (TPR) repeat protein
VAFSPDGNRMASGGNDKAVHVCDARTGKELLTLRGHTDAVNSVAFSADGARIASGGADKTVRVWDASSGREKLLLKGHTTSVLSVAFSPDGNRIASASSNNTLRLWDLFTARPTLTHEKRAVAVCFSPNGGMLATGSAYGVVFLYPRKPHSTWHLWEAAVAEDNDDWYAAAWHLERAIRQETALRANEAVSVLLPPLLSASTLVGLRRWKGRVELGALLSWQRRAYLELGRWAEAEAVFLRLRVLNADVLWHWYARAWSRLAQARQERARAAAANIAAGAQYHGFMPWPVIMPLPSWCSDSDTVAFRKVCAEMVARFPSPTDPATANALAWTRLLVGDGLNALEIAQLAKLAKLAVDAKPKSSAYRETYGAALYRLGHYDHAVRHLEIAIRGQGKGGTVWQNMFLAMALHRLDDRKDARKWLTKAVRQIERREKAKNRPDWDDRVQWHYLREEAERTLGWRVPPPTKK